MRRLLVVEDDAAIRDGIVCLLRRNGYAAAAVTDFADVAGQILAAAPDLVLLDLNLPGVDGGFTCREVRAASQVPIIAVTSRDTDMDELVTLSAGADDFVTKPYNEQVLLARISSVLKRSYGEGRPPRRASACAGSRWTPPAARSPSRGARPSSPRTSCGSLRFSCARRAPW